MQNKNTQFKLRARVISFKHAWHGLYVVLNEEYNFRIHLVVALTVIALGGVFAITRTEWIVVILCIGIVLTTEIINTAIEKMMDIISPQKNEKIRIIKDIAAGGVLIVTSMAVVTAIFIFLPYLLKLF
jgi:diacylglycerol kinase (ATP)